MRPKQIFAHKLAAKIAIRHDLSYKSRIALEATINELFTHNITVKQGERLISNLFKNLCFVNHAPMLPLSGK